VSGLSRRRAGAAMRRRVALSLVALGALALTACAGDASPAPEAVPPACPTTLILQGAERTAAYTPGADASSGALQHMAVLTNLATGCRFGEDGVDVDLAFDLIAERGPAMTGDTAELTYFVATLGPGEEVLAKQLLTAEIAFAPEERVAGVAEELTYRLPSVTAGQGQDYMIYLGFQLDPAELDQRLQPLFR
jgi:hypothetical protein